jgi:methionine sulfoxide reductase heme-binding subunit
MSLWYAARATGMVSLLLLTGTVLLGILGPLRVGSAAWPRFAVAGLHRNISLLTLTFLGVHVVTVVSDSYVPIGWLDPVVPFVSAYHPFWVGLGAVAFDLLLALVATSLLRSRVNPRLWRALHWLAYACWPVALTHALGVGTDAASGWPLGLGVACAVAVLAGVAWRLADTRRARLPGERQTVAGRAV